MKEYLMNHSNRFLRMLCCALVVSVLAVIAPLSALADFSAVVTSSSMRVYAACSTSSPSAKLSKGTVVTVRSYSNGVAKISYKGKTGYARVSDMDAVKSTSSGSSSSSSSSGKATTVCTSDARAYKSASTSSQSVAVKKGTKVNVLSTSGSWAKVEKSGNTAWMRKSALMLYADASDEKDSDASSSISGGSKADQAISAAKAKLGCGYTYGKSGPDTFDCSGLVKYAFKQVGVSVGGSSKSIGYNAGSKVGYGGLKPGDIVCFDTSEDGGDDINHTGIYLGSGKFIHGSSAAGKVIISTMSSGYYRNAFCWGRRVL